MNGKTRPVLNILSQSSSIMSSKLDLKEAKGDSEISPARSISTAPGSRRSYFFGVQGKTLIRHVSIAGAVGFLLFGYDQGVLGVSISTLRHVQSLTLTGTERFG